MGLNVVTYTGYTFEDLFQMADKDSDIMSLINATDILIDGVFDITKRNLLLKFRGSENQRIIDIKKTLKDYQSTRKVVTIND